MISLHLYPTLQGHLAALLSSILEEDFVSYLQDIPSTYVAYLEDYFDLAMTHYYSIF